MMPRMDAAPAVLAADAPSGDGGDGYARLRDIVHERTGFDLDPYKGRFLLRRLAIRQRATGQRGIAAYADYLEREAGELDRLMRCLTIHVSTFFRNPTTYEAIRTAVLPRLFAPGSPRVRRFWSVGCARGEEPYSLAILVLEHLGAARRQWDVHIHGIDVDDRVLEDAKAGVYGAASMEGCDERRRERWFRHDGRWHVVPEVRRLVRFHRRDVLMDPPGGEYDFVLCRNLLIYLGREGQAAAIERFARALRPGGFLVLGRTEILVGPGRSAFEVVDARERIYRRLPAAAEGRDG